MKLSICIDTANDNVTNNIVAIDHFSTLIAYGAVTDVYYTVLSNAGKSRKPQVLGTPPCHKSAVISKCGDFKLGAKNNCSDGTANNIMRQIRIQTIEII